jgi:hypothetical protein
MTTAWARREPMSAPEGVVRDCGLESADAETMRAEGESQSSAHEQGGSHALRTSILDMPI